MNGNICNLIMDKLSLLLHHANLRNIMLLKFHVFIIIIIIFFFFFFFFFFRTQIYTERETVHFFFLLKFFRLLFVIIKDVNKPSYPV